MQLVDSLKDWLSIPVAADEIQKRAKEIGISLRTLMIAKSNLGILSERNGNRWF